MLKLDASHFAFFSADNASMSETEISDTDTFSTETIPYRRELRIKHYERIYPENFNMDSTLPSAMPPVSVIRTCDRVFNTAMGAHNDMLWMRNGENFFVATAAAKLGLVNLERGMTVLEYRGHQAGVNSCSLNAQENIIISGCADEKLRLFDMDTGCLLQTMTAHRSPIACVHYNPYPLMFCSGGLDGCVRIWDANNTTCVRTLMLDPASRAPVSLARFTPNGLFLVVSYLNGEIRVWDISIEKTIKLFRGHTCEKYSAEFDFDNTGRWILAGSEDNHVYVWDWITEEVESCLTGHTDPVSSLVYHPEKPLFASSSLGGQLCEAVVWERKEDKDVQVKRVLKHPKYRVLSKKISSFILKLLKRTVQLRGMKITEATSLLVLPTFHLATTVRRRKRYRLILFEPTFLFFLYALFI
ncbi:WD repeat-containing protein 5B [Trichinella spiralis]|uniref:WD repeat domain-containing protein 83 n=1 Tax=Trichinella spiralis TaxID=6334 RepID=A0ABR3KTM3_TRISP